MKIVELKDRIERGETTAVKAVTECLERVAAAEEGEEKINAVITLNREQALKQAREIDEKIKRGEKPGMLGGVPVAVKDVLCTKNVKTTAASRILSDFMPTYDATCVSNLKQEGAIIVAKTNCDEFAHGASGENSAYGSTKNPLDISRVAGGSSSGSGAIVAYGGAAGALGTDTGGSVRVPASFMGLTGLKPTYGRVSRKGLIAMCSSTDTVAPIANNVEDAALLLTAISSKDSCDATSSGFRGKDFSLDLLKGLKGLKIAYPKEVFGPGLEGEVKQVFLDNLERLRGQGAKVEKISLEFLGEPAVAVYYILVPSEISSNLARFDGICFGERVKEAESLKEMYVKTRTEYLGDEVKRRIMLGNYSLSAGYYDAYYNKAQKVRRLIREEVKRVFTDYDLVITPTTIGPAFKLGQKADPLSMYLVDMYLTYASLAGIPAVSLNGGWVKNKEEGRALAGLEGNENRRRPGKLPVGIQLMANWWDEETLLRGAYGLEKLVNLA
ncbi:MAG: Asp-tRNA(Asn)/Glu-tRNA(Gln) amidotransferase subunit GatA [Patescibacteria group bacterium]|nr:Asp-tRNA(Asn)/Glu-tRNA(Gln) amidotransferase subunit GatA [Patescibacteria group bacterium]